MYPFNIMFPKPHKVVEIPVESMLMQPPSDPVEKAYTQVTKMITRYSEEEIQLEQQIAVLTQALADTRELKAAFIKTQNHLDNVLLTRSKTDEEQINAMLAQGIEQ